MLYHSIYPLCYVELAVTKEAYLDMVQNILFISKIYIIIFLEDHSTNYENTGIGDIAKCCLNNT